MMSSFNQVEYKVYSKTLSNPDGGPTPPYLVQNWRTTHATQLHRPKAVQSGCDRRGGGGGL